MQALQVVLVVVASAGLVAAVVSLLRLRRLERRLARLARYGADRQRSAPGGLRTGLVRFSAYNDVAGDYSFALAVLDPAGDGVVLTGLYHRDRCRVYARPVEDWRSPDPLSEEEAEAITRAREDGRQRMDLASPAGYSVASG